MRNKRLGANDGGCGCFVILFVLVLLVWPFWKFMDQINAINKNLYAIANFQKEQLELNRRIFKERLDEKSIISIVDEHLKSIQKPQGDTIPWIEIPLMEEIPSTANMINHVKKEGVTLTPDEEPYGTE